MNYQEQPYFASHYQGDVFRLEKNDAMGVHGSDGQAIQQCIKDALRGSVYALKQLVKAAGDPLVREYMEELK